LWADPAPAVDYQLPDSVVAELDALDAEITHPAVPAARPAQPARPAPRPGPRSLTAARPVPSAARPVRTWRDDAYEAELAEDYTTAADLHVKHDDPLRAARLYERAAERS
jgi:hypothetical protein